MSRKGKTTKSRTDRKIIRRQYVCNKEGLKKRDKRLEGRDVQFPRDTRCECPAKMEVVLNDLAEWVLVKLVAEHNHPLLATPSKSRMHRSHATAHRWHVVRRLVSCLSSEGIGLSNIARVCNAAGAWSEQNIIPRQCGEIVRSYRRNNVGRECLGIIKYFKQREEDDGSFFFSMDVGDDGALRSVF